MCSGEDDRESEGGDHDACCEEDGELLTGVAHGVRVVHQSSRYAVRNGREDVKKQHKEGPVLAGKEREVSAVFVSPVAFQHTKHGFVYRAMGNDKVANKLQLRPKPRACERMSGSTHPCVQL